MLPHVTTDPSTPKLCECGCGQPAPIAKQSDLRKGYLKGEPLRFIKGHYAKIKSRRPFEERFWEKVDKRGPDDCWEWQGSRDDNGYGRIGVRVLPVQAHRVSYELNVGPIPDGLWVLHKCDNPPCVNPNHLFLGTHLDNLQDMFSKGRGKTPGLKGESIGTAKLSEDDVRAIRDALAKGASRMQLVQQFNMSYSTIERIEKRLSWSHVE